MNDKPITTIKYLCEFYGISQTELARKYDIPLRTVQQWHAGHRTPPPYVVNMILELLHREHCEKERDRTRRCEPIIDRAVYTRVQSVLKATKPAPPPLGYKLQGGELVKDDEEAEVVTSALAEMAQDGRLSHETEAKLRHAWRQHYEE